MMSSPAYGVRPAFCPAPDCPEPKAIARLVLIAGRIGTIAFDTPAAKLALPPRTKDPSLSSTACQLISVMSSGEPEMLRSNVTVVAFVSRARSIRAPISAPPPAVCHPARRNVLVVFTAGLSVAVTDVVVPVIVVMDPRWTLMSAALVNSTTCHDTMWPALSALVRSCRFVVEVRSATTWSSLPHSLSPATGVFENSTNAWLIEATAVMATLTTVADWAVSPRWTLTPDPKVATYH